MSSPAARRTIPPPGTPTGHHDEDRILVRGTLVGEPQAVSRFVERMRCVPSILAAQNARLGTPLNRDDLVDLVQDTLAAVWKKLSTYAGRASLETWVYRFCYLELMNTVRRKRRQPRLVEDERERAMREPEARPDLSKIEYEEIYLGLERLGPPEADVIRLKHFEELTFDEISARLEISPNTAKTQYYRGMSKLRQTLALQAETVPEEESR